MVIRPNRTLILARLMPPPGHSTNARGYSPGPYHSGHYRADPLPMRWLMLCAVAFPIILLTGLLCISGLRHPPALSDPTIDVLRGTGRPEVYRALRSLDPPLCGSEDDIGCGYVGRDLVSWVTCVRADGGAYMFADELGAYGFEPIRDSSHIVNGAVTCPTRF